MEKLIKITVTLLGTVSMLAIFISQAQALSWETSTDLKFVMDSDLAGPENEVAGSLYGKLSDTTFLEQSVLNNKKERFEQKPLKFAESQVRANSQVPVVPEPQTYAMILAGLGLLGITLSRRKNNTFD